MKNVIYQRAIEFVVGGLSGLVGLGMPEGSMDFSDAPSGDLNLDDIFGEPSSLPTTAVNEPTTPPEPSPTTDEPFLKAKTGTVYKTKEDAELGIARKDELIAQLREKVRQETGADPLRQRREEPRPVNYVEDQEKYLADISDAVNRKDTAAYMRAQQKLILDTMAPMAPTLISLNKANAERVVAEQYPEFRNFKNSEEFNQLEQESPLLIEAIRQAENNPAAAQQLPELYRIAYLSSQGRKVPELIQSVRSAPPPVQPRPTVHSAQVPPPATTGVPVTQPSLDNKEGRKALIEQMEGKGVRDLKW